MKITIRVEGAKLSDLNVKRALRYLEGNASPIQVSLGEGHAKVNLAEASVVSCRRTIVRGANIIVIEAETPEAEEGCLSPISSR